MSSYFPLASNAVADGEFKLGVTLVTGGEKIEGISLDGKVERILLGAAKRRPFTPHDRADHFEARLTLTYSNITGLKHASIYDLTTPGGIWKRVAVLNEVTRDLDDLDVAKGSNGP